MKIPALAEDGDDRGAGFDELAYVAVLIDRVLGEARGAECGQLGMLQFESGARSKKSLSFGLEPGQPPSM